MNPMAENPFTKNHEPYGFLVQSQGRGLYMILQREENGWKRVQEDVPTYIGACDIADSLAAPLRGVGSDHGELQG